MGVEGLFNGDYYLLRVSRILTVAIKGLGTTATLSVTSILTLPSPNGRGVFSFITFSDACLHSNNR